MRRCISQHRIMHMMKDDVDMKDAIRLEPCSDRLFHIYFWFLFLISNLFHLDLISSTSLFPLFCHPSLSSPLLLRCAISPDGSYDSVLGSVSALPLYPTAPGSDCT